MKTEFIKLIRQNPKDTIYYRLLGDWYSDNGNYDLGAWCNILAELKNYNPNMKKACREVCRAAIKANLLVLVTTRKVNEYQTTIKKAGARDFTYLARWDSNYSYNEIDKLNKYWDLYGGLSYQEHVRGDLLDLLTNYAFGDEDWINHV